MTTENLICPYCKTVVIKEVIGGIYSYDCFLINDEYFFFHYECLRKIISEALEKQTSK